ncbi:hypothetical protein LAZ67_6000639 [Cordylochernes scorpioides]|uniref:Uncharacterized protein n=1 Tax=Cordylochernes scorpioides TaxID=51811 RepID=A0ABY6KNP2_9ARAC|nr:hypothetical protein LAZ67_6000639 [Cordylochernes scorpioides]
MDRPANGLVMSVRRPSNYDEHTPPPLICQTIVRPRIYGVHESWGVTPEIGILPKNKIRNSCSPSLGKNHFTARKRGRAAMSWLEGIKKTTERSLDELQTRLRNLGERPSERKRSLAGFIIQELIKTEFKNLRFREHVRTRQGQRISKNPIRVQED